MFVEIGDRALADQDLETVVGVQDATRFERTSTMRVPRRSLASTGLCVCDASDAIVRDARTPD